MSGPVDLADTADAAAGAVVDAAVDVAPGPAGAVLDAGGVEISDSRTAEVGGMTVRRALPRRGRRTVGAWCFADHMGPRSVSPESGVEIGPHPHMGLQTVTWLLDGQLLHRDSLGSEQVITAGQLNLMTAGHGVAHSEEGTGHYRGELEGIQLWVAQPEPTRHGAAAFEHHAELPVLAVPGAEVTVLVGELGSTASPARHDSALVGLELKCAGGSATMPLVSGYEYAAVVLRGAIEVGPDHVLGPGKLGYLGRGRDELAVVAEPGTRAMLLGGEPFDEPILMWWNFVARDGAEFELAYRDWEDRHERFGTVTSQLPRIPAPPLATT